MSVIEIMTSMSLMIPEYDLMSNDVLVFEYSILGSQRLVEMWRLSMRLF